MVGIGVPMAMCAVLALNSLQKSIDLTPFAPRAGPTGGVGAALPAGTISLCQAGHQHKLSTQRELIDELTTNDGPNIFLDML